MEENQLWFYVFWSKNQNKSKLIRNFTKLYWPSRCIFIELSAKEPAQNSNSRSTFWCFGFLSYWRIKNSYLIHPLSENSNFLCEMSFFMSLTCVQKIMKKFNLYITFSDARLKKYYDFTRFGKKFKINWGLVNILRKFADHLHV